MSDDGGPSDNVVHLGTKELAAIGDELRRMYDFYLRSKPPERLERLLKSIGQNDPSGPDGDQPEAGEGVPSPP
jgi:hypothetical protein